jgi:hypothetical protein
VVAKAAGAVVRKAVGPHVLPRVARVIFLLLLGIPTVVVISASARALSIQEFNTFSRNASYGALRFALTTETYRNIRAGNIAVANCIERNFVPTGAHDAFAFACVEQNIKASKAPETESVESYILGSLKYICGSENIDQGKTPDKVEDFEPSPVWGFFQVLVNDEEKIDVLRLALSTQALREINQGNAQRAQCIMNNLVGKSELPKGFSALARQLFQGRESSAAVESYIIGAIISYCGEDKP